MTSNQLRYRELKEQQRHNIATEHLGLETLNETIRHNVTTQAETRRSNLAREAETNRHNAAVELEAYRANRAGEELSRNRLSLDWNKHAVDTAIRREQLELQGYSTSIQAAQQKAQQEYNTEQIRIHDEQNAISRLNASVNQQNANTRRDELAIQWRDSQSKAMKAQAAALQSATAAANLGYQQSVGYLERQLENAENSIELKNKEFELDAKRYKLEKDLLGAKKFSYYTGGVSNLLPIGDLFKILMKG